MCEECKTTPLNYDELLSISNKADSTKNINELTKSISYIKLAMQDTNNRFLTAGRNLKKIRDEQLWMLDEGYNKNNLFASFEGYILTTLDISKSTVYRLIQVYEMYGRDVATYEKYNYSQLQELCCIQPEDSELLKSITPNLTISTIRKLKHQYYENKAREEQQKIEQSSKFKLATYDGPMPKKTDKNITYEDIFHETEKIIDQNSIEPLVLKNKTERQNFLTTYRTWELIANVDYLKLKIYRRRLKNQTAIIALVAENLKNIKDRPAVEYSIFVEPDNNTSFDYTISSNFFNLCFNSENNIIDYLTKHKTEIE